MDRSPDEESRWREMENEQRGCRTDGEDYLNIYANDPHRDYAQPRRHLSFIPPSSPCLFTRLYRRSCSMNRVHEEKQAFLDYRRTRPTGLETRHYAHDGTPRRNDSRRLRAWNAGFALPIATNVRSRTAVERVIHNLFQREKRPLQAPFSPRVFPAALAA